MLPQLQRGGCPCGQRRAAAEHQLLLKALRLPERPTIRAIAQRLQIQHNSAVELVKRAVAGGLVERRIAKEDRREETGRTDLPVVDCANLRKLVGRVTLRDMLKARVRHLEEEQRRERVLPLSLVVPTWLRSNPSIPPSGRLPIGDIGDDGGEGDA